MLVKTKGIVLRSIKYGETSLIVDCFTEQLGLRSYIINGVRKAKPTYHASLFQITSLIDMVVYNKPASSLNRVKEVKRDYIYQTIPYSPTKSAIAQFMLEITKNSVQEKEPNPELFRFVFDSFKLLDESTSLDPSFHLHYIIRLSEFIGFRPEPIDSKGYVRFLIREGLFINLDDSITPEPEQLIHTYLHELLLDRKPKLDGQTRKAIVTVWVQYLQYHVDGFRNIQSLQILSDLLH